MENIVFENKATQKTIEQQANSQENPTLLLISRLKNPEIFEQLVFLYVDYYKQENLKAKSEKLKERIQKELNKRIEVIEKDTPIMNNQEDGGSHCGSGDDLFWHDDYEDCREKIQINKDEYYNDRINPNKWEQTQSITESHEKGHFIRTFGNRYFRKYFCSGFDTNVFPYTTERVLKYSKKHFKVDSINEDHIKNYIGDGKRYLFTGYEIAERMSQLKSYFGMKGNEKFTLKHLAYAREHYIPDTGFDNNMSEFFSAITKETESRFIELINSSGI